MAAAAVQGEQFNNILQCSICIDVFTDPRTLPCLHTFCVKCIADWCKDTLPGEEVTCPECREEFVIPDSGVDGLKRNFFVANILSMNKVEQKTGDLCEICVGNDKNVSEMFCLQCGQSYCESCSKAHLKMRICSSHTLVRLDELQSRVDLKHQPQYCDKHIDKLIEFYCLDDEVAVCIMCCILDHRSHRCEEIKNIANQFRSEKWKQDLQNALNGVEDKLGVLNSKKIDFLEEINVVGNEICKEADKKIQLIKDHKQKIISELETIKTQHEQEIDKVNQELVRAKALLSTFKGYCDELLKKGSDVDICQERNSLCKKTEELLNMKDLEDSFEKLVVPNVIFSSSNVTFGDAKSALGELEAVMSDVFNESEDEMLLQGTSTVTDESDVSSGSKHESMLPVTPTVTDNPQLFFTLDGGPGEVSGVAMLDNCVYVVYDKCYDVQVFDCQDGFKKNKNIEVNGMRWPSDIVGCSVTSQLFVSDMFNKNIWRMNINTGVSDVFIAFYRYVLINARLSLVENRLLVTSRDSLLMYDIHSGQMMKSIPLTEDMKGNKGCEVYHAIESNRDSFFVSHQLYGGTKTVSEIDSRGRVIRKFYNKEQLNCGRLAFDSAGRLLVADYMNYSVVLFDEHLKFIKMLLYKVGVDDAQPENNDCSASEGLRFDARPVRLSYNKNNNKMAIGFNNGYVKIFDCHV